MSLSRLPQITKDAANYNPLWAVRADDGTAVWTWEKRWDIVRIAKGLLQEEGGDVAEVRPVGVGAPAVGSYRDDMSISLSQNVASSGTIDDPDPDATQVYATWAGLCASFPASLAAHRRWPVGTTRRRRTVGGWTPRERLRRTRELWFRPLQRSRAIESPPGARLLGRRASAQPPTL